MKIGHSTWAPVGQYVAFVNRRSNQFIESIAVRASYQVNRYHCSSLLLERHIPATMDDSGRRKSSRTESLTRVLPVDASRIGHITFTDSKRSFLKDWKIELSDVNPDATHLREAASLLRNADVPVAFPTETVYGLGADATRSAAVQGIYRAKQRPSDNPLIVHIGSLSQLRALLSTLQSSLQPSVHDHDPIPPIYQSLISRFWPGPLTILVPLPTPSPLAPEVTAALPTVAVRMPSSLLALALIQLAGVPLAAPSANASSRPSPTTAAHVLHDLNGRIDMILDGGACDIGVESTVVDGLSAPPVILRPGGISIDKIKQCAGWEDAKIGYVDGAESGVPRAPGMKYKHYSPTASVLLFHGRMEKSLAPQHLQNRRRLGILATETWRLGSLKAKELKVALRGTSDSCSHGDGGDRKPQAVEPGGSVPEVVEVAPSPVPHAIASIQYSQLLLDVDNPQDVTEVWSLSLGPDPVDIARGLFSALRELDAKGVDVIFIEGIDDSGGGARAAIMNRLRKAAEAEILL